MVAISMRSEDVTSPFCLIAIKRLWAGIVLTKCSGISAAKIARARERLEKPLRCFGIEGSDTEPPL
jgi:hypothetical protein